jgi:hypothetical protein
MSQATLGFSQATRTRTRGNPYPQPRVRVLTGTGVGFVKPTGFSWMRELNNQFITVYCLCPRSCYNKSHKHYTRQYTTVPSTLPHPTTTTDLKCWLETPLTNDGVHWHWHQYIKQHDCYDFPLTHYLWLFSLISFRLLIVDDSYAFRFIIYCLST